MVTITWRAREGFLRGLGWLCTTTKLPEVPPVWAVVEQSGPTVTPSSRRLDFLRDLPNLTEGKDMRTVDGPTPNSQRLTADGMTIRQIARLLPRPSRPPRSATPWASPEPTPYNPPPKPPPAPVLGPVHRDRSTKSSATIGRRTAPSSGTPPPQLFRLASRMSTDTPVPTLGPSLRVAAHRQKLPPQPSFPLAHPPGRRLESRLRPQSTLISPGGRRLVPLPWHRLVLIPTPPSSSSCPANAPRPSLHGMGPGPWNSSTASPREGLVGQSQDRRHH